MSELTNESIKAFIDWELENFQIKLTEGLAELDLKSILKRKNPYLCKAKNLEIASDLVKAIVGAYVSSKEETVFGEFLEKLAIFVSTKTFGGFKSASVGIDLEQTRDGIRYFISIKSGPNWGNSGQIKKMIDNFNAVRRTLRTNSAGVDTRFINGCCYGRDNGYKTGDYEKLCGEAFWELISGRQSFYLDFIKPLGERSEKFHNVSNQAVGSLINRLTEQFLAQFCFPDKRIDWEKLVKFVSQRRPATLANSAAIRNRVKR
ncbi:MAG: PmeII family type II restriction endonuclease [Candidatus Caenarcaniphilales bacterium]|nr:PmeII family type II restriction endonuclease [Candidatus Caenarcaniphilales bacterium]